MTRITGSLRFLENLNDVMKKRELDRQQQLPASLLASFPCKLNTFRNRVKYVVTSKGIQVGIGCK
jgi:hypothetical protein